MLIEQAIYTSCQTSRSSGYQLVAASPGIVEDDARELSLWGPSHDSLWEPGPAAVSVNFHRLASGAYCISQTTPAGAEYSQRRGPQIYTQSLVVDAQGLAEFENNPFSLLQASIALGHVCVHDKPPKRLEPFWIDPEPQASSKDALDQLVRHPGPVWLGLLLDAAINSPALGIVAGERGASLVAALVQCLPRECRAGFSFTTGLRCSPRRTFRVVCLPNHAAENRRIARQQGLTLFEMKSHPPENASLGGWASFITATIASGNTDYLAAELAQPREALTLDGVNRLGDQLAQGLRALQNAPPTARTAAAVQEGSSDPWQRADAAHPRISCVTAQITGGGGEGALAAEAGVTIEEEPARVIGEACPTALTDLQSLEDIIFEAMAGKLESLDQLIALWPRVLSKVGSARAESSREHYLRYTLAVWRQLNAAEGLADCERSLHAMEVICVLFEQ